MSEKYISAESLDSNRQMRAQVTGTTIFLNYGSFSVGIFEVLRICLLDDKETFSVKNIFLKKNVFC